MKLSLVLVFCLAITVHHTRAEPSIFDAIGDGIRTAGSIAQSAADTAGSFANGVFQTASNIAQGAVGAATGISKGAIGVGTGILSNLNNLADSFSKAIAERINDVRSKILQRVLQQVQSTLQKVQDNSRAALQASEVAGEKISQAVIALENKKQESIQEWADKAKDKLSNSSEDAQLEGQDLIEGFANQRSEDLKKCTDKIVSQLEQLQEKANATADRYHKPMNTLIEQVGKCSELKANDFRGLASCAAEIREDLKPLASAPIQLASVKAQLVKVGVQNLQKEACVASTFAKFRQEAIRVNKEIDQLVAEDKKKSEEKASTEEPASEEPASEESESEEPESDAPSSDAPSSHAPSSDAPSSDAPTSNARNSNAQSSEAPASEQSGCSSEPSDEPESAQ